MKNWSSFVLNFLAWSWFDADNKYYELSGEVIVIVGLRTGSEKTFRVENCLRSLDSKAV